MDDDFGQFVDIESESENMYLLALMEEKNKHTTPWWVKPKPKPKKTTIVQNSYFIFQCFQEYISCTIVKARQQL